MNQKKPQLEIIQGNNLEPIQLTPMELIKLTEPAGTANQLTAEQEKQIALVYTQAMERALKGEPILITQGEPLQNGMKYTFSNPEGADRWVWIIAKFSIVGSAGAAILSYALGMLAATLGAFYISTATITTIVILTMVVCVIYIVFWKLPKRRVVDDYHSYGPSSSSGKGSGGNINVNITQNNY